MKINVTLNNDLTVAFFENIKRELSCAVLNYINRQNFFKLKSSCDTNIFDSKLIN